jgi:transcriptional regulator of NAD metabolism
LALEQELMQRHFVAIEGTHGMLGALLVAAELIDGRRADQCVLRAKEMQIPLGRYLVCEGIVSKKAVVTALKCQQLLREQKMKLQEVIDEIKTVKGG